MNFLNFSMGKYQMGVRIRERFYIAILEGFQVKDLQQDKMESELIPVLEASENYAHITGTLNKDNPCQVLYVKPLSVDKVNLICKEMNKSNIKCLRQF